MAHLSIETLVQRQTGAVALVPAGTVWQHTGNQAYYVVVGHGIEEKTDQPVVLYQNVVHPGLNMTRPLQEFLGPGNPDKVGENEARFREIGRLVSITGLSDNQMASINPEGFLYDYVA